ncbi:MAG: hypothetical protein JW854_06795 [Actinobacteria bacterium]|nr:hypothetical protein [Actinomycetota bacterium]
MYLHARQRITPLRIIEVIERSIQGKWVAMVQKATTRCLLLIIFLLSLPLIIPCGCNGKGLSEKNKALMESLEKQGVGNPANRDKYSSEEYRDGYDAGYKNGYTEGKGDYARGEDFTPSSMIVKTGNTRYDVGFVTGNLDGYYDAYEDCIRIAEEAEQLAASEEDTAEKDKKPEEYTFGPEYDEGYEIGYDRGYKTGKRDKEAGISYNPSPRTSDVGGSEERQQGAADGYKEGYEEGYEKGQDGT